MKSELKLKDKAISLRKAGFSYAEISKKLSVSKSTLHYWLRKITLTPKAQSRINQRKILSAIKGGQIKKQQRIDRINKIHAASKSDIKLTTKRDLLIMGSALHWAEGTKEKEDKPGMGVQFSNSDPVMLKIFLKFLIEICNVDKKNIYFNIFIHENKKNEIDKVVDYWQKILNFPKSCFSQIYFKKNKVLTKRKNIGENYWGVIKIRVKKSSALNHRIVGWALGVVECL